MDYLQTLPPDVLRQTALKLSPKDVIKLMLDSNTNKALNNKFWQEKHDNDFEEFGYNTPLQENIRNHYILDLITEIENEENRYTSFANELKESNEDLNNWKQIINLANNLLTLGLKAKEANIEKEKYKEILYQLRIQQYGFWPRYYEDKPENPQNYDVYGSYETKRIWFNGRWHKSLIKYFNSVLKKLKLKDLTAIQKDIVLQQIYLYSDILVD